MDEYIEFNGTKASVMEGIMEFCALGEKDSERCLDFLMHNQEILSIDEVYQYSNQEEYAVQGVCEFVTEDGGFYISIKKSTLFFVCLFLGIQIPETKILKEIAGFLGINSINKGVEKLDSRKGYSCIMLELARNRKRGAAKNLLAKFEGECCNNQLDCRYNENGNCTCSETTVEKICEEFVEHGFVKKKGAKYYYIL